MKIGNLKLENNLVLAPMATITDVAFRVLCKRHGAGLVFTEMINANAISRGNKASFKLADTCEEEKPVGFQIFGTRIDAIKDSVKALDEKADLIDLNLGCPVTQVLKQGAGAALLKRPAKIKEIIEAMVSSTEKPVTAKMRIGFKKDKEVTVKIAKIIEEAGASAITVHARTVGQGYSGKADWRFIKAVKEAVNIPVIGNGDVTNGKQAKAMLDQTNCDGIMIGRAARGDPAIFVRVKKYLEDGTIMDMPTKEEKKKIFFEYLSLAEKFNLLSPHIVMQRAQEFTKSIRESRHLRERLNKARSIEDIKRAMLEF